MKKILIAMFIALAVSFSSCDDMFDLDVKNINEPTLDVLNTEEGMMNLGLGVYVGLNWEYFWIVQAYHEIMGDILVIPWGNFSWRWANQPTWIQLDDGTKITPPQEADQAASLRIRNDRAYADDNAFQYEWEKMYYINNISNLILSKTEEDILFSGNEADQAEKKNTLKALAHWWKGFAYSRLGSIYSQGLIIDEYNTNNDNYLANSALLAEATKHFDLCIVELDKLSGGVAYEAVMGRVIPDFVAAEGIISPAEWKRNINTFKARNLLVNKKTATMTSADWDQIIALANSGIQEDDVVFYMRNEPTWVDTETTHVYVMFGWMFPSERYIQDYRPGDARYTRNFSKFSPPTVNRAGRGIQYGWEHAFVPISDGGDLASDGYNEATIYIGPSYEENELMLAEAKIHKGQVEDGLDHLDAVRSFQQASLPPAKGAGLTEAQAKAELFSERRVALAMRAMGFYDYRRWGVIDPIENGGGRAGCVVFSATGVRNTNATINYNYLNYWDVPATETVFNAIPSVKK